MRDGVVTVLLTFSEQVVSFNPNPSPGTTESSIRDHYFNCFLFLTSQDYLRYRRYKPMILKGIEAEYMRINARIILLTMKCVPSFDHTNVNLMRRSTAITLGLNDTSGSFLATVYSNFQSRHNQNIFRWWWWQSSHSQTSTNKPAFQGGLAGCINRGFIYGLPAILRVYVPLHGISWTRYSTLSYPLNRKSTHSLSLTMMQTASYYATPVPPAPTAPDPLRVSVNHLLARAHNIPCTAAAQAFTQLVQPSNRFQVALDVLLPLLSGNAEVCTRIRWTMISG